MAEEKYHDFLNLPALAKREEQAGYAEMAAMAIRMVRDQGATPTAVSKVTGIPPGEVRRIIKAAKDRAMMQAEALEAIRAIRQETQNLFAAPLAREIETMAEQLDIMTRLLTFAGAHGARIASESMLAAGRSLAFAQTLDDVPTAQAAYEKDAEAAINRANAAAVIPVKVLTLAQQARLAGIRPTESFNPAAVGSDDDPLSSFARIAKSIEA